MRAHVQRQQGFTLVELMIVMVASSLVIAGAFSLHQSFARQSQTSQKVAEVQQTVRLARQYLEKHLRLGGSGLNGGQIKIPMLVNGVCVDRDVGGLMIHNSNSLNTSVADTTPVDVDTDPDWLEFGFIDVNASPTVVTGLPGNSPGVSENININVVGTLTEPCSSVFAIPAPNGKTCTYIIKQITGGPKININVNGCKNAGCVGSPGAGFNQKLEDCTCDPVGNPQFQAYFAAGRSCEDYVKGMPIANVGPGVGGLRLFPQAEATTKFSVPFGVVARAAVDMSSGDYTWSMLNDLVEDLQFEVFLSDGRIYGTFTNSMDVPLADWGKIRAVRYSLRVASRTPAREGLSQTIPAYADQCASGCTFTDGRVRRLVQGVVQSRNFGL